MFSIFYYKLNIYYYIKTLFSFKVPQSSLLAKFFADLMKISYKVDISGEG